MTFQNTWNIPVLGISFSLELLMLERELIDWNQLSSKASAVGCHECTCHQCSQSGDDTWSHSVGPFQFILHVTIIHHNKTVAILNTGSLPLVLSLLDSC
jgi:hypothetical protein